MSDILREIKFRYIQFCRYFLKRKYLKIMSGELRDVYWSTKSDYSYIIGDYEEQTILEWAFEKMKNPDSVFYDVGANIGYFSFMMMQANCKAKIIGFEPIPEHVQEFQRLIDLNKQHDFVRPVKIINKAVCDTVGTAIFSYAKNSEGNTLVKDSNHFIKHNEYIEVETINIDEFVRQGNLPPNLIKIDVEGVEFEVIKGALNTITTFKPAIILATHECHRLGITDLCKDILKELGYKVTSVRKNPEMGLEDFIAEIIVK